MRWTSLCAAGLLAAGIVLFQQTAANSADGADQAGGWTAEVTMDDGAPREVSPLSFEALRAKLEPDDPLAVLEAVGFALTEVGDGSTYIWHRTDEPLMGQVRMIASFHDEGGALCRRIAVTLELGGTSRPADAVACRDEAGRWVVGG